MNNKEDYYYKAVICILRFIGFTSEEINAGIEALPDNGILSPSELIITIGVNALNWKKEHEKN